MKWEKLLMLSLVVITQVKSSTELRDSRLSRTSITGSELGLSKDKECTMVPSQCRSQVKTLPTQPSSTLVAVNFLFHLMYSIKSRMSGPLLFQTSIAPPIRLSATSKMNVKISHQRSNQLVSK